MVRNRLFTSIIIFFCVFVGCRKEPTLPIFGDIPIGTSITSLDDLQELVTIHNISNIFLVTKDSIAVEMRIASLSELNIVYKKGQWDIKSETLPRTTNLKDLHYIAVESDFQDYRLALFNGVDKQEHLSAYQGIKKEFEVIGTSSMNGHSIWKYEYVSPYYYFICNADTLLTVFKNGNESFFTPTELSDILIFEKTHWKIKSIKDKVDFSTNDSEIVTILWENYPNESIFDIYTKLYTLNRSNLPTLLILIDGLGWNMVENAKARNRSVFFENLDLKPMRVKYPPKTRTVMALIETWFHEIEKNVADLLRAVIIQNDRSYLSTKIPIILNTDRNNDGFIDDEVFETAMEYIKMDYDFILVHFKSIDDVSHVYGPYSENTIQRIEQVCFYVQKLMDSWEGAVIIFSDHGQHNQGFQGNHGVNRIEDMVGIKN
ncbi:MAG: alkaline phosphatase family protein [Candidatus Cloacimonetes bacterium]|nr:alkaline phosphatase family protein [Candidatus Cloacimonadota bacterium]